MRRTSQNAYHHKAQAPAWRFMLVLLLAWLVAFAPVVKAACELSDFAAAGGGSEPARQSLFDGVCHDAAASHDAGLTEQLHAPAPVAALAVLSTSSSPPSLDVVPPAMVVPDHRLAFPTPVLRRHAAPPVESVIERFGRLLI